MFFFVLFTSDCISFYPKKQITKNDCMFYAVHTTILKAHAVLQTTEPRLHSSKAADVLQSAENA